MDSAPITAATVAMAKDAKRTEIRASSPGWIVMMDADGQHDPKDIPSLLAGLERYHMVIGARGPGSNVSMRRRLGNAILSRIASTVSEMSIPDLTTGFRAVRRESIIDFLDLLPNKFSYPTTMTLVFIKRGYFIKFLPLSTIRRRQNGRSKLAPFKDAVRFFLIIMKECFIFC